MSYILDALKKAERERGSAEVVQAETAYELPRKKRTGIWIVAGCGLLCLAAAGGLFLGMFYGRTESSVPTHTVVNQGYATEDSVDPPENLEPIAQSSTAPPVLAEPIPKPPVLETTNTPVASVPVSIGSSPKPPVPETTNDQVVAVPVSIDSSPKPPVPETANAPVVAVPVSIDSSPKPPTPKTANAPAAAVTVSADIALNTPVPEAKPRATDIEPVIPSLREIAGSIKMNIGMHVYSDNPDKRLVFINGKRYKEGDLLEQDCVIEGITPEGVLLKRREETVVLRLNGGL